MTLSRGRNETPEERADRNLLDLLQELRVALPGVQVLFAFLLAVPFQPRFEDVTTFQRDMYFAVLLLAAVASALLIAPGAYHRLNFSRGDKPHIVEVANRFAIAGIGALALAMTGAVVLVSDWLFDGGIVPVASALVGLLFAVLWFGLPLRRRWTTRPSAAVSSEG